MAEADATFCITAPLPPAHVDNHEVSLPGHHPSRLSDHRQVLQVLGCVRRHSKCLPGIPVPAPRPGEEFLFLPPYRSTLLPHLSNPSSPTHPAWGLSSLVFPARAAASELEVLLSPRMSITIGTRCTPPAQPPLPTFSAKLKGAMLYWLVFHFIVLLMANEAWCPSLKVIEFLGEKAGSS